MPAPILRGAPRDWRVATQSPDNARQFKARQATNELHPCGVPGCHHNRAGVSRYCGKHRDAASARGCPVARLPSRNELAIFKHAIKVYLDTAPRKASQVSLDLAALERRMALPASFCLNLGDIHHKLPQAAKASGLKANWVHRRGRTYTEAVTHALALMGWMAVYFDGLPETREGFLRTQAGALLGVWSKTIGGKQMRRVASGATCRHLGAEFLQHSRAIYGRDFWSSPVSTHTHSMTILAYTKAALRAAHLLSC